MEGLKCGKDFGLLAYNDIPSYEVIDEGITSLSIDWEMMGKDVKKLQELIDKLEVVKKEEQEKKNEIIKDNNTQKNTENNNTINH